MKPEDRMRRRARRRNASISLGILETEPRGRPRCPHCGGGRVKKDIGFTI